MEERESTYDLRFSSLIFPAIFILQYIRLLLLVGNLANTGRPFGTSHPRHAPQPRLLSCDNRLSYVDAVKPCHHIDAVRAFGLGGAAGGFVGGRVRQILIEQTALPWFSLPWFSWAYTLSPAPPGAATSTEYTG